MGRANSFGLIKAPIMEISSKTTFTVKANINGLMAVFTTDSGSTTKWKDKELLHGVMGVDTKETTKMIKNMVTVRSSGRMAENISVNGAKANSMVKVFTSKKAKRDRASGTWVKERSGSATPLRESTDEQKS